MNDLGAALAAHPFFAAMPARLLERLAPLATTTHHPAGSWIARNGEPAERFFAVTSGRAGVEITAACCEPLVVATVHAGEVIGWSWFVEPHRWHFDVVALDDVTTIALDAVALREACAADHELGYEIATRLARVVASRLDATRHQLIDVYGRAR